MTQSGRRRMALASTLAVLVGCATGPVISPGPSEPSAPAPLPAASMRGRRIPASAPAPAPVTAPAPAGALATGLELRVEPPEASVSVDGRSLGRIADLGAGGLLPLPPGIYQVSVSQPGYATWRAEVAVRAEVQRIDLVLEQR